jgi:hypothetical protein
MLVILRVSAHYPRTHQSGALGKIDNIKEDNSNGYGAQFVKLILVQNSIKRLWALRKTAPIIAFFFFKLKA